MINSREIKKSHEILELRPLSRVKAGQLEQRQAQSARSTIPTDQAQNFSTTALWHGLQVCPRYQCPQVWGMTPATSTIY